MNKYYFIVSPLPSNNEFLEEQPPLFFKICSEDVNEEFTFFVNIW